MRIRRILPSLSLAASFLCSARFARATEDGPAEIPRASATAPAPPNTVVAPAASEPRLRTEWYGWQTLSIDGATIALAVAGSAAAKSAIPALLAGGFFIVSGSIVHGFRGRGSAALTSLGLRAGLPAGGTLVGGLIGFALTSGETNSAVASGVFGALFGGALGGGLGILTASALDAALLGHETIPDEAHQASVIRFHPIAYVSPGGAHAGVAGTF